MPSEKSLAKALSHWALEYDKITRDSEIPTEIAYYTKCCLACGVAIAMNSENLYDTAAIKASLQNINSFRNLAIYARKLATDTGMFPQKLAFMPESSIYTSQDAPFPREILELFTNIFENYNISLDDLPALYAALKSTDSKVAEGSFYSSQDEIEFLARRCLFDQLFRIMPLESQTDIRLLSYQDLIPPWGETEPHLIELFVEVLTTRVHVVDPSCGTGNFLVEIARIVGHWISSLVSPAELPARFANFICKGLAGVDSDPIAVGITRKRIAAIFCNITQIEDEDNLAQYVDAALRISIEWGNAFGLEMGDKLIIAVAPLLEDTPFKELHEDLCSTTTKIYQTSIPRVPTLEQIKEFENLEKKQRKFFNTLVFHLSGKKSSQQPRFTWDVNFFQVISSGGFEIVIGNPPYIRQEDINAKNNEYMKPWRERKGIQRNNSVNKRIYKEMLKHALIELAGGADENFSSKADFSTYFFLLAKYLCQKGGICGYITPNAWLDVEYGFALQDFLLKKTQLIGIYEKKFARSFSTAVNTILTLFIPNPIQGSSDLDDEVEFLSVGTSFKKFLVNYAFVNDNEMSVKTFHSIPFKTSSIPDEGTCRSLRLEDLRQLEYCGASSTEKIPWFKWGSTFFRAPDFLFTLREQLTGKLGPFLEFIDINFGTKTGKNSFFIIPNKQVNLSRRQGKYLAQFGGENLVEFPASALIPILTSTRGLDQYTLKGKEGGKYLVLIQGDRKDLAPGLRAYVEWGEKQEFDHAPSCQAHMPQWYTLPRQSSPDFAFFRFVDQRSWVPLNQSQWLFSDNFFVGYAKNPKNTPALAAYLNSTFHLFFCEVWGRTNLGAGLLTFYGPDYAFLEVMDPGLLDEVQTSTLTQLFHRLASRPVYNIKDEIRDPDRNALDAYIAESIFDLAPDVLPVLYEELFSLLSQRSTRARGR